MHKNIHIAVVTCDNYAQHTATLIASVLANKSPDENIIIYVLQAGLSPENIQRLQMLQQIAPYTLVLKKVDRTVFADFPLTRYAEQVYYRLLIPSLLSQHTHRVLYLDSDTIVLTSLWSLFSVVISNRCFLAAVADFTEYIKGIPSRKLILEIESATPYFNSGVLLWDFTQMPCPHNFMEICTVWLMENRATIKYPDQDILNAICGNYYMPLPLKYNYQTPIHHNFIFYKNKRAEIRRATKQPSIVHYNVYCQDQRPWAGASIDHYRGWYRKYLKLTAWKKVPLREDSLLLRIKLPIRIVRHVFKNISGYQTLNIPE